MMLVIDFRLKKQNMVIYEPLWIRVCKVWIKEHWENRKTISVCQEHKKSCGWSTVVEKNITLHFN